jgi:hypothetical protein
VLPVRDQILRAADRQAVPAGGRKFIGIDIDRKHIETTRRRVEEVAKGLETM